MGNENECHHAVSFNISRMVAREQASIIEVGSSASRIFGFKRKDLAESLNAASHGRRVQKDTYWLIPRTSSLRSCMLYHQLHFFLI